MGDSRAINYGPAGHSPQNICLYGTPKGICMVLFLCIYELLIFIIVFATCRGMNFDTQNCCFSFMRQQDYSLTLAG